MPDIDVNDLAMLGVVNDVPAYQLPPEAFTTGLNVRYQDSGIESLPGWEHIFGTPGGTPHFMLPMSTPGAQFWIYASLNKIFVYDGVAHVDISRPAGYNATDTWQWNGTIHGGVPILNNGVDIPQARLNMTAGTKFTGMANFVPVGGAGTMRAKVIRSFAPYLVAFNLTDSTFPVPQLPHTIAWSHPSDPGSLPSSWDYSDPTKDAGRKDLDDVNSGIIIDALPLRGVMYVYKENSTWRMSQIGGRFIFDFKTLFDTSGILTHRCVALTGDGQRHVVVTQDDMIWHNGSRVVSILDRRQRTKLFAEMDTVNFYNSFLFCNPLQSEMWFCYPTSGNIQPNKALIWNYKEGGETGVISFADGITFRNAGTGNIQEDSEERWSTNPTSSWAEQTEPWSVFSRRRTLVLSPDNNKFYNLDRGLTRDGVEFTTTLRRDALSMIGRKRNGEWIVDMKQKKMFQRLWPKMQGGPVNIRIGVQDTVNGPTTWQALKAFDPATMLAYDVRPLSGALMGFEISGPGATSWRIDGYKMEIALLGIY